MKIMAWCTNCTCSTGNPEEEETTEKEILPTKRTILHFTCTLCMCNGTCSEVSDNRSFLPFNVHYSVNPPHEFVFTNLLKCMTSFYLVYYMVVCLAFGGFKLEEFNVKMPFDFLNFVEFDKCCSSYSDQQLANLVTMQLTFFLAAWVIVFFIHTRVWNYSTIITFIHFAISCSVMQAFPMNWSWWICLLSGMVLMVALGEMVCYCRRNQGQAKIFIFHKRASPEPQAEVSSS